MVRLVTLALVVLSALLSGCASTLHGTTQEVGFRSIPSGATVAVSGQSATTPTKLKLSRSQDHAVTFTKDGHPEQKVFLKQKLSGAFYGNLALGGIIGMAIDMGNGAAYDLAPGNIEMHMETGVAREFDESEPPAVMTVEAPPPPPPPAPVALTSVALPAAAAPPPATAPAAQGTAGLGTGVPLIVDGVVYHPDTGRRVDCQVLLAWKLEERSDAVKSAGFNREVGGDGAVLTGLTSQQLTTGMAIRDACQQATASR